MMECVLKTQSITSRDVPADSIGAPKLDFDGLLLFFAHFSYSAARWRFGLGASAALFGECNRIKRRKLGVSIPLAEYAELN